MQAQHDTALAEALANLRTQYEQQAETYRLELIEFYERQRRDDPAPAPVAVSTDDSLLLRAQLDALQRKYAEASQATAGYQVQIDRLEMKVSQSDTVIAKLDQDYKEALRLRDVQIASLRKDLFEKDQAYRGLLDTQISLDAEIRGYDELLGGEEGRLFIAPSPGRTVKRKRVAGVEEVAFSSRTTTKRSKLEIKRQTQGAISIEELDVVDGTSLPARAYSPAPPASTPCGRACETGYSAATCCYQVDGCLLGAGQLSLGRDVGYLSLTAAFARACCAVACRKVCHAVQRQR